jgi:hypothetical protein
MARDLQSQVADAETVPEDFTECPPGIAHQLGRFLPDSGE